MPEDLVGKRFGKQVVLKDAGRYKYGQKLWLVRCDCGDQRIVAEFNLKDKKTPTKSCYRCMNKTHGYNPGGHPHYLYRTWRGMKNRCYNKKEKGYKDYGDREITVCKEWHKFIPFKNYILKVLGERPEKHSLDRIDNDGNYEPGNIRWATGIQQSHNSRRVKVKK